MKLYFCIFSFILLFVSNIYSQTLLEKQYEDLEFAKKNYVLKSRAFSAPNRQKAINYISRLQRRKVPFTNEEFLVALARIPGFANNAHDSFDTRDGWFPATRLPFRLLWFTDAMIIARTSSEQSELLGAKIEKIEGMTPAKLLEHLRLFCGAPDDYVKWNLNYMLESGGLLHALGVAQNPSSLRFDLALKDGRRVKRTVSFVSNRAFPQGVIPIRLLSAAPFSDEVKLGWQTALSIKDQPLYLQDEDEMFRMKRLPEIDSLYVQFRINMDFKDQLIEPFVERVLAELNNTTPRNFVLDLRFNTGGSIEATYDLMQFIAKKVKGRIYVLTSGYTFSAGIISAAAIKRAAGNRVVIVGSHAGDRLRFWSEGENACLPNSGYCLHLTTGLWDLFKGCKGESGCYGDQFDARLETLEPQIKAPITANAWLTGSDPGLEAVKVDLNKIRAF